MSIARIASVLVLIGGGLLWGAPAQGGKHDHAGHHHAHGAKHAGHSHDEHHLCEADIEMPKTYAEAVERIKQCRETIGEEFAEGHLDEVHAPLDEAVIILKKLMIIARDSGVPKSRWADINLASKDLKKRLDELHLALDQAKKIEFAHAAKPIDAAIARLESAVEIAPATAKRGGVPR